MKTPSSRHLSHDFPAYKGLTLRELAGISIATTIMTTVLFIGVGLMTGWVVGLGCLGCLVGFIASVSLLPKPIARRKLGKPHGYLMKTVTIKLGQWGVKPSPYLKHTGVWQKSKRIGGRHV